jgi:hypothetical protein
MAGSDRRCTAVGGTVVDDGDRGAFDVGQLLVHRGKAVESFLAAVPVDDDDLDGGRRQNAPPIRRLSRSMIERGCSGT